MAHKGIGRELRNKSEDELHEEANVLAENFDEWNDVFDILSAVRTNKLSELEAWCLLSKNFNISYKPPQCAMRTLPSAKSGSLNFDEEF